MFEEEENNDEELHDSPEENDEDSEDFVLEGKRWADGGFVYGFNAASASVDFLRQKSRRTLKKRQGSLNKTPSTTAEPGKDSAAGKSNAAAASG